MIVPFWGRKVSKGSPVTVQPPQMFVLSLKCVALEGEGPAFLYCTTRDE